MRQQDDKALRQAAARAIAVINQDVGDDYKSVVQWQQELHEAIRELVMRRADQLKAS
jgi:hypothetical protein